MVLNRVLALGRVLLAATSVSARTDMSANLIAFAASKSGAWLLPTPGFTRYGSTPRVGGKRFFSTAASSSRMISITGMRLYEWLADGSAIECGTVAVDAKPGIHRTGNAAADMPLMAPDGVAGGT